MKFAVVVPQLFYDLIARVLPGFFFLLFITYAFPGILGALISSVFPANSNLVGSLGQGFVYIVLCYFLGLLFFAFTRSSLRESVREKYEKEGGERSLNSKYQWIRLAHPAAGFRIVKLRAEARMFETTRTAMLVVTAICFVSGLSLLVTHLRSTGTILWGKCDFVMLAAAVSAFGFRKCEKRAWTYYWRNIRSIYKILHNQEDPIPGFNCGSEDTEQSNRGDK